MGKLDLNENDKDFVSQNLPKEHLIDNCIKHRNDTYKVYNSGPFSCNFEQTFVVLATKEFQILIL